MSKRNTEKRIKAVEMHKQGFSRRHIAETLGVSPDSVKTWIAMYKNGQEDLLEENTKVRLYSQELKLKAVSAHLHDGRTLHDVTASFAISDPSVLKRWCREYRAAGIVSSSVRGRPRKHLDNPEEIIKELEMQVAVLKKALELQRRG